MAQHIKFGIERGGKLLRGMLRRPDASTRPEGFGYGRACIVSAMASAALREMLAE